MKASPGLSLVIYEVPQQFLVNFDELSGLGGSFGKTAEACSEHVTNYTRILSRATLKRIRRVLMYVQVSLSRGQRSVGVSR